MERQEVHLIRRNWKGWRRTVLAIMRSGTSCGTSFTVSTGTSLVFSSRPTDLNRGGLGQYLAQRMPVMLITIPGNYIDGGWTNPKYSERIPGYVLGQPISAEEAGIRN